MIQNLQSTQLSRSNQAEAHRAECGADFQRQSSGSLAVYELHFRSLFNEGRGYSFPCDAEGHVDLDALSAKARNSYFYARTVIGREFSLPAVQLGLVH